ncbi:hypothetical protein PZ895_07880 [Mesorhizobium sp. YIM 152430]|uniref:hypothetical protein n=1 Tax=Mesorhizobium sp. YIM 152430 TaxID=3031761 RepID=UPI0023DA7E26|nr:hypothetical protein [Mesorhizobium sp. YIM 152430]MDF1599694.1 hypothetical protein [Mesorhizobium sp. YIM 152430]
MSYLHWHVGMKVVCVEGANREHGYGDEKLPETGRVYTIREIKPCMGSGVVCITLREIVNEKRTYFQVDLRREVFGECAWPAHTFRPIQDRKTDISVFTALLNDQKQKEPA